MIENKHAFYSYHILDKYVAGIVLHGPEVRSVRLGNVNLKDSYCFVKDNAIWIKGMHISNYAPAAAYKEDTLRPRKLLLTAHEIRSLKKKIQQKGHTLVTLRLFINRKNLIKLEIALAKGKKLYDKRAAIKERELKRKISSVLKNEAYSLS